MDANNNSNSYKFGNYPGNDRVAILDWRVYWYLAKRRKWFLIVPAILFGLGAFYYSLTLAPTYESSTTIMVSGGKLMTRAISRVVPGVTADSDITAARNYVLSAQCIAGLINTLGLRPKPALAKQAAVLSQRLPDMTSEEISSMLFIEQVRENIKVETRGRDIIKIAATHGNPQKSFLLAKTLGQVFIDEFQKRQLLGVRGIREFSDEQLSIFEDKLAESEEKLRRFKQGILREQVESDTAKTFESLRRLREDLVSLDVSIRDKSKRLDFIGSKLAPNLRDSRLVENAAVPGLKRKLFSRISDMVRVLSNFDWRSPQILALNDAVNLSRGQIRDEIELSAFTTYNEQSEASRALIVEHYMANLDREILTFQKNALRDLISSIEKSLTKGPTHEMILANLGREVDLNRKLYLSFFQQSQGTQIEEQIQRRDAKFKLQTIEPAQKPLHPINKGLITTLMVLCLPLAGLALGGGVVYGLDYMDRSVKDVDEVEREYGLPVWGVIPEIDNEPGPNWQRTIWVSLLVTLATAIAAAIIYLINQGAIGLRL